MGHISIHIRRLVEALLVVEILAAACVFDGAIIVLTVP